MNGKSYRTPTFVALASILILLTALTLPLSVVAAESTWRGEYYNNENLTGAATFVREDANIDSAWTVYHPQLGRKLFKSKNAR